jgi:hypothetical protein
MKRISIILFSVFYLLVTAGFNVSAHWCGEKINFISIDASHDKKCSCGEKMTTGCCKDVHFYVKVTDSQKISSSSVSSQKSPVKEIISFCALHGQKISSLADAFHPANFHAPPLTAKLSVYLVNRVFRI